MRQTNCMSIANCATAVYVLILTHQVPHSALLKEDVKQINHSLKRRAVFFPWKVIEAFQFDQISALWCITSFTFRNKPDTCLISNDLLVIFLSCFLAKICFFSLSVPKYYLCYNVSGLYHVFQQINFIWYWICCCSLLLLCISITLFTLFSFPLFWIFD